MRLAGKYALVTGAAGGIGGSGARRFAAEGAAVALLDRDREAVEGLAAELTGEGATALAVPADLTDEEAVAAAYEAVADRFPRLDVLYTCAAIQPHHEDGPVGEVSLATWQRVLAVNLTGTFLAVRGALPLLRRSPAASVVLCGSPTGMTMCGGGSTAYAASKGGVHGLAQALAGDLAPDGIRVNVVVPGTTRTPLIAPLLADEERHAELVRGVPLGRLGEPDDVSGIALYLASDEAAYATAGTFTVDGGLTHR